MLIVEFVLFSPDEQVDRDLVYERLLVEEEPQPLQLLPILARAGAQQPVVKGTFYKDFF